MKTKKEWMDLALTLAEATTSQTNPNPSVGAVVVKDGELLGVGTHLKSGEPHAEVHALKQAGEKAVGADIYVTLEPCAHYGKTPPCAELIVEKGIKHAYIACVDPNPKVAGKGIHMLKNAGISVEVGILEQRALSVNRAFFHTMRHHRPFVTLKAAMTLDGKTATATGDSKWVTDEEARIDVHKERHKHDAILVGRRTVEKDNPQLTTRLPQGGKNPIRIILDTQLALHDDYAVFDTAAQTWIVCGTRADITSFHEKHPHVTVIQMESDSIQVPNMLTRLAERGIQSLYVEGGGTIHEAFIKENVCDECHWYIAPKLLTGQDARSVVGGQSPQWMYEAEELTFEDFYQVGPDIKVIARPKEER
ncbi:riboflavin specific deaminase [Gracilibacillus halophilus YIM-C55.5]|uniref:Riboflavin biosynthesis protein RibD n=1 Tax=Gracilibacillus halophilus YIM-C55.5 TaxID=1308866 RepID=N4WAR7_9BACI|nr:bifunctional diaminohydroxyphosphoribosylaminopyrimidine deaminase/5-amino-6-(5-phosphoribosylamino)uracil reductase RibD [Gracilibacillus halophilus]ENH96359.1 riboflavin specific deaminase [Gracilibacillus halophilus YIM-C55.5]